MAQIIIANGIIYSTGSIDISASSSIDFILSGRDMMRISSSAVGINTFVPQTTLHVFGPISASSFGSGSFHGNLIGSASYALSSSFVWSGINNYVPKWQSGILTPSSSIVDSNGFVGIGTTQPTIKFEVSSSEIGAQQIAKFSSNDSIFGSALTVENTVNKDAIIKVWNTNAAGNAWLFGLDSTYPSQPFVICRSGFFPSSLPDEYKLFVITNSGSVGIGVTNPVFSKLQVFGHISASGFGSGSLHGTSLRSISSSYASSSLSSSLSHTASFVKAITPNIIVNKDNETLLSVSSSILRLGLYSGWGTDEQNLNNSVLIGLSAGQGANSIKHSVILGNLTAIGGEKDNSVIIGEGSGWSGSTSNNSVLIGNSAGIFGSSSNWAVMVGASAGYNSGYVDNSIFIGSYAGQNAKTASNAILIGDVASAYSTSSNINNSILLGGGSISTPNTMILGSPFIVKTWIRGQISASVISASLFYGTSSYSDNSKTSSYSTVSDSSSYLSGSAYLITDPIAERQATPRIYIEARSENLITNGSGLMGNNYNFSTFTFQSTETHGGKGSFYYSGSNTSKTTDEYIPVDPSKTYLLKGWAKSGEIPPYSGSTIPDPLYYTGSARQYLGIVCYDIDKNTINPAYTMKYPGSTDTYLMNPLNSGDTSFIIQDSTGWHDGGTLLGRHFLWYGWQNSFGYTYPPFTYTRYYSSGYGTGYSTNGTWAVGAISSSSSGSLIHLTSPWLGPTLPSGSAIRNAYSGGTYKYIAAGGVLVPTKWTLYDGYIGEIATDGSNNTNKFHYGTAFVKVLFLVNYPNAGSANNKISWSDLWFSEMTTYNLEAASTTVPGIVTTGSQTWDGFKTLEGSLIGTSSWADRSLTASYFGTGTSYNVPIWINNTLSSTSSIRLASNGFVGIGTTDTKAHLDVYSETSSSLRLSNINVSNYGLYAYSSAQNHIYSLTRQDTPVVGTLMLSAYGGVGLVGGATSGPSGLTPDFYVNNVGSVGIATINPRAQLHVFGPISASSFGSGSLHGTASYSSYALSSSYVLNTGRFREITTLGSNLSSGSRLVIPNNKSYTPGLNSLSVYANGLLQYPSLQYVEQDSASISFKYNVPITSVILFYNI